MRLGAYIGQTSAANALVKPTGTKPCDACAGTGQTSPWEWNHIVWVAGKPHAVCGGCRGSGLLMRFGLRLSQRLSGLLLERWSLGIPLNADAIATEARRAETSGSVEDEGAGRKVSH